MDTWLFQFCAVRGKLYTVRMKVIIFNYVPMIYEDLPYRYCGIICGIDVGELSCFSGTVFGDIIHWKPLLSQSSVLQRISGHEVYAQKEKQRK